MGEPNLLNRFRSGTHALVDLDRLEANIHSIRETAGPGLDLLAVVKASAYGHGSVEVARSALQCGAAMLGVARIEEGLELRRSGVTAPILVIGPPNVAEIDQAIAAGLELSVGARSALDAALGTAHRLKTVLGVHLKVDTGMHRYGFFPDEAVNIARGLREDPMIDFAGIFSHFSSADEADLTETHRQQRGFESLLDELDRERLGPRWVHLANSAGIANRVFGRSNLVRAGIMMYGVPPSDDVVVPAGIEPVSQVRSTIARVFSIQAGQGVSYGHAYVADRGERLAVIPVGYADGLERHLSNRGWFLHQGRRCPIRGRVSMDQTLITVPDDAVEGDYVVVFGAGAGDAMTLVDVARLSDTIPHEVMTRLGSRVPRIYHRSGIPVSWWLPMTAERGAFTN